MKIQYQGPCSSSRKAHSCAWASGLASATATINQVFYHFCYFILMTLLLYFYIWMALCYFCLIMMHSDTKWKKCTAFLGNNCSFKTNHEVFKSRLQDYVLSGQYSPYFLPYPTYYILLHPTYRQVLQSSFLISNYVRFFRPIVLPQAQIFISHILSTPFSVSLILMP